jgi:HPt (histidine-containing phosphotransfer) domain-containing protein
VHQLDACLNKYVRNENSKEQKAENSGRQDNIDFSRQLLSIFCKDARKAVVTLNETIANGDIKLFTTTAHAMKSALANIEENEISELAFALEQAGLNGDREYIAVNTEHFIKLLETLIKKINPLEITAENNARSSAEARQGRGSPPVPSAEACQGRGSPPDIVVNTGFLVEQLQIIKAACEEYDRKAAFAALDLLKEKQWKTETAAMIENIFETLYLHSDFDGAGEFINAFINNKGSSI